MEPATLKMAMAKIGLEEEKADELLDMLDEIEFNRRLKISMEQFDRGETLTLDELKKRTTEKLNNGYYLRQR
jgi:orotidine-5'-phosphate decarboxylase